MECHLARDTQWINRWGPALVARVMRVGDAVNRSTGKWTCDFTQGQGLRRKRWQGTAVEGVKGSGEGWILGWRGEYSSLTLVWYLPLLLTPALLKALHRYQLTAFSYQPEEIGTSIIPSDRRRNWGTEKLAYLPSEPQLPPTPMLH